MGNSPSFFLAGCQKTASTWVYRCLRDHPDVFVPKNTDTTHYFDMFYYKGSNWYKEFYEEYTNEKVSGDTTPSYIRSNNAPKRIYEYNKNAKIIFTFRNPIDRAFSHYWHEKKKQKINFEFKECLENYDLYSDWIETGFYYKHVQRYLEYFPRENIKIMIFDDLKDSPVEFINEIYKFLEVDSDFIPSVLNKKVNKAGYVRNNKQKIYKILNKGVSFFINQKTKNKIKDNYLIKRIKDKLLNKNEYEKGMNDELRDELRKIFEPENKKLENFLNRKLDWD